LPTQAFVERRTWGRGPCRCLGPLPWRRPSPKGLSCAWPGAQTGELHMSATLHKPARVAWGSGELHEEVLYLVLRCVWIITRVGMVLRQLESHSSRSAHQSWLSGTLGARPNACVQGTKHLLISTGKHSAANLLGAELELGTCGCFDLPRRRRFECLPRGWGCRFLHRWPRQRHRPTGKPGGS